MIDFAVISKGYRDFENLVFCEHEILKLNNPNINMGIVKHKSGKVLMVSGGLSFHIVRNVDDARLSRFDKVYDTGLKIYDKDYQSIKYELAHRFKDERKDQRRLYLEANWGLFRDNK